MGTAFGDHIRRRRLEKDLGLREAAKKMNISAPYLSRIESGDEMNPPSQKVIESMAAILDEDATTLMRLAGRVENDIVQYVSQTPVVADFLRTAKEEGYGQKDFAKVIKELKKKG